MSDTAELGRVTSLAPSAAAVEGDEGRVRGLVDAAKGLEEADARGVLAWLATAVPRPAVTSSFGAESAVLLHLLAEVAPQVPVLFLDTGLHFPETLAFRRDLAEQFGLQVVDLHPLRSVDEQARDRGHRLWERDPDACCGLRKTVPLRQALRSFDGWASGVRRVQTPERADTPVVEARRHDGRWLVKVAPLAAWTDEDVGHYLDANELPRHPLASQGFRSIGCAPCTTAVAPDQDPRAGRWASTAKTECGIHLDADGAVERTRAAAPG